MKKRNKLLAFLLCLCMLLPTGIAPMAAPGKAISEVRIVEPQVEYMDNPLGIEVETPRFSWHMESSERGQCQTAYRVLVSSSEEALNEDKADIWDSGKIASNLSVGIEYEGPQQAMTRYYWKVQVWDKDGAVAESDIAWWETGLMDAGWSGAQWIGRGEASDDNGHYKFTIDVDFTVEQTAFGLIFGAKDEKNFYMWQVNGYRGATALLRPHVWTNGSGKRIDPEIDISDVYPTKESMMGSPSHMTLSVDNGAITTTLNGIEVNTTTVEPFDLGRIGFRATKTNNEDNERFYVDNIVIKDEDGNVLFEEKFDDASNPNFDGGTVADGQLYAENTLFLQKNASGAIQEDGDAAPMLRKTFSTEGREVKSARLYATAAGIYDFSINGQRVTDDYFNPGRTTLDVRAMYQTFDVTGLLQTGDNAMGAVIGNGWYQLDSIYYGDYHSLYAKLVIDYTDGSSDVIVTDESWKYTGNGPVLEDDFWQGETYDARLEMPGWNTVDFDDSGWLQAGSRPQSEVGIGEVVAQVGPTVKNTITLPALEVTEPEENVFVYDFGQNFAGIVRIHVTGEAGQKIRLRYAEMLNDAPKGTRGCDGNAGTIYQANLRSAKNTDYYILKGDPNGETFEPSMVFHGFRYLEITGIDEPLPLDAVEGVVLTSVGDTTSTFESSNELVNQLYSNTLWGQRSNFLSIPTDCPQRDERRGFTGDAQIFARTATYNMDVAPFLEKFMQDICDNQTESGAFPHMAPSLDGYNPVAGGWMDAGVIIPWQLYQQYGDKAVLEKFYDNMCRYMDHLVNTSTDYIRNRTQYGDWLNIGESTPNDLLDTSFCVYSSDLMVQIAKVLGDETGVAKFTEMAQNFRTAWQNRFVKEDGTLLNGSQTGYALGLYFNIFKESDRNAAAAALVDNIKAHGWHLTTGFCGVSYLAPALSSAGYHDVAYRLLEQETYPSWLYPVLQGATTVWERWNSYTLESGFGDAGMNSFNHYAYGSVMEWVFRYGVGIERDEEQPGYKHFILQPTIGGSFSYMKGSYDSIYGMIESGWTIGEDGAFTYDAAVPANTTATLYLPEPAYGSTILENGIPAEEAEGVVYQGVENGKAVFELSSGNYSFSLSIDPNDTVQRNVRIDTPQGVDAKAVINGQEYTLPMDEILSGGAGEIRIVSNDPNYTFAYWGDGVFDTNPERMLPSEENVSYAAYFQYVGGESEADMVTLVLNGEEGAVRIGEELHELPYTGAFQKGTELIIAPVAPSGKTFSHWEGGTLAGNPAAAQLNGDVTATAVFEEIEFESNLALGKKPSTNSNITVTGANDWDISNLTDGVYVGQGYSSVLTQSEDASSDPVWAEIDLEKDTVFDRVILYPRTDAESYQTGNHAFPQDFTISVKKDGENEYQVVKTITGHADSAEPVTLTFDAQEARYVRLTVTKFHPVAKRVQLAEMAVVNSQQEAPSVKEITISAPKDFIEVGETLCLTALALPENASNRAVNWYLEEEAGGFSGKGTLTYDETGAVLTGVQNGVVKVVARAADGSGATASYQVKIGNAVEPEIHIVPQVSEVVAGEYFTVQAIVPTEVEGIALFNEYGLKMGARELTIADNEDGSSTYTFKTSIGTVGKSRKLTLVMLADGQYRLTDAVLTVDVVAPQPEVYFASIEEQAKVNQPVTVTVVTNQSTKRVSLMNEYGLSMGILSKHYEDTEEGRVWTLSIKIGTRGSRCFFATAYNQNGVASEAVQTNQIIITEI